MVKEVETPVVEEVVTLVRKEVVTLVVEEVLTLVGEVLEGGRVCVRVELLQDLQHILWYPGREQ